MQTLQVHRKADKIASLRASGKSWVVICNNLKILTAAGKPDTVQAYQIMKGKQPGREVLLRLGWIKKQVHHDADFYNSPAMKHWRNVYTAEQRHAVIEKDYKENVL